jgi:hypothetical protein
MFLQCRTPRETPGNALAHFQQSVKTVILSPNSQRARRTLIRTFVKSERMIMQPANHTFGFFCQRAAVFLFA